ncbi:MAG TPA: hypothetical protein VEY71_12100, partial [Chitinophagales bacterium]|nr:hypothetical protein [Chitinophagales bacterium]
MRTFLIAAWWVLCAVSAFGQNHFDPEHTRRFAAHLFNTGRYDLAQLEYARLTADLPCSDSTQLYMIKAFRMNNNACEGLARFNDCLANGLTTQRDRAQEWVKLKLLCISDPELDEHVLALTVDTVAKTFLLMNVYLTQAR